MRLVEKYRPKTFEEIIGQDGIIANIKAIAEREGDYPHLLFVGPPGSGKTSMGVVFAHAVLDGNMSGYKEMNASDDRGIEVFRGIIKRFSRTVGKRVMLLDEFDNTTPDAQNAFRRSMEKTKETIFVLTGNNEHKIIEAIHSRCATFKFKPLLHKDVLRRLLEVCQGEGIDFTPKEVQEGLKTLVLKSKGDLRKAINDLDKIMTKGKELNVQSVIAQQRPNLAGSALTFALHGDFDKARELIETAFIRERFDPDTLIQDLYTHLSVVEEEGLSSELTIRLFAKLAELERWIKMGTDPIVQFVGFMSYVWIAPHLKGVDPF